MHSIRLSELDENSLTCSISVGIGLMECNFCVTVIVLVKANRSSSASFSLAWSSCVAKAKFMDVILVVANGYESLGDSI